MNARMKFGKIDGPLNPGGTVTLSVWNGPLGEESDSGEKLVATDWLMPGGESIRDGAKVAVAFSPIDGDWYIVAAECPD